MAVTLRDHLESLLRTLDQSTAANRMDMDRCISLGFDHRYSQGRADAFEAAAEWLRDVLAGPGAGETAGREGGRGQTSDSHGGIDGGLDLTPAGQSAFRRAAAAYANERS